MSTIRCDNFGPSAGGTTYSARGIAKAWVNFNGTGTIAARDSENVSSLTDNGTGDYTVNFSSVFGAADYAATLAPCRDVANDTNMQAGVLGQTGYATSSVRLQTRVASSSGLEDAFAVNAATHGDLA
jgi:hypothetical protein